MSVPQGPSQTSLQAVPSASTVAGSSLSKKGTLESVFGLQGRPHRTVRLDAATSAEIQVYEKDCKFMQLALLEANKVRPIC